MRFKIRHETRYTYSMPVSLGPHVMRLRPREDGTQRLLSFHLDISPTPSLVSNSVDAQGNIVVHAWFLGTAEHLRITSSFEAEVLRRNPFDYVPDLAFAALPGRYAEGLERMLSPFLEPADADASVRAFAHGIAERVAMRPLAFLDELNREVHEGFHRAVREDGPAQSPAVTLAKRKGACRDLAVLYIDACRVVGLAARFVSGYRRGDPSRPDRHLHAWPEVYIPGGGWRGWDPVEGLAVADTHVALAAAARQAEAMPVEGAFYGSGATSKLHYRIHIQAD
jgi:transglutaminase-like putative cysteine protease